jgi:diacylglycerol kinase (ATP)
LRIALICGPRATPERSRPFREAVPAEWTDTVSPGVDAVIILGGDGTVHRHLKELADVNAPVLAVPTGSGNDFASSLGIHNPNDALHAWKRFVAERDNIQTIDLGCVTETSSNTRHLFCNVANLGLDSEANRRANLLSPFWRANGGYVRSLLAALFTYRAPQVTFSVDDNTIGEKLLLSVAANGKRYGRGLHIAPRADMSDGFLDLCFVRDTSKFRVAALFPLAYFGQHLGLREVQYRRFRQLTVESDRLLDIYADGEFLCHTPATIEVIPQALRMIVP